MAGIKEKRPTFREKMQEKARSKEIEDVSRFSADRPGDLTPPEGINREYKVTFRLVMTMAGFAMSFAVAEVIPLFLITLFTLIAIDLGDVTKAVWLLAAQIISVGAISPFVGTLTDLLGRKGVTLLGLLLTIIYQVILGTAPNVTNAIIAQVIGGISVGIQLLTAVAAVTELVPTYKRGLAIGFIVCGFLPFAPAPVYGQLLAQYSWRWISLVIGIWSLIAFILIGVFYSEPPRPNALGLTKWEIVRRMDIFGAFLGISGLTVFLVGVNWGGQDLPWRSVQVVGALTSGLALMVIFMFYECYVVKYPLFPGAIARRAPRQFAAICFLSITSGINYMPLVVFWTVQCYTVYRADFHQTSLYDLPIGFCIAGGAILSAFCITLFRKRIPLVLMFFCVVQTAGLGAMAAVSKNNINTAWAPLVFGLIGVGGVLLPSQVIFSIITPHDILGAGVALSITIRSIGQVVGLAIFYNIFVNSLTKHAPFYIGLEALSVGFKDIPSITKLVKVLAGGPLEHYTYLFPDIDWTPANITRLQTAGHFLYAKAIPELYLVAIAFGGSAIIGCCFLFGVNKFMDEHVAVHLA